MKRIAVFSAMRSRAEAIGLTVTPTAITAVLLRGARVVWSDQVAVPVGADLAEALTEMLARAGGECDGRRVKVVAALSAAYVQLKAIPGLPQARARTLAEAVRANHRQFFATSGESRIIGGARRSGDTTWAASYDAAIVAAVQEAAGVLRITRLEFTPAATVLPVPEHADRCYTDDGIRVFARYDSDGRLAEIRRAVVSGEPPTSPSLEEDLAATAALQALTDRSQDPVKLAVAVHERRLSPHSRLVLAGSIAIASAIGAVALPACVAVHQRNVAEAGLRALAPRRVAAAGAAAELASATSGVKELAAFDAGRRSAVLLLSGIASVLPPGSALVDFHADSVGGTMVIVAPRSADVLDALGHVTALTSPAILGPVTHEQVPSNPGGAASTATQYERMTIQFRYPEIGS